jgi:hypothetical protein
VARFGSLGTQYFNASGEPLVNGLIYFYESGTTTPKATYADINQTVANPNPVVLDASGYQPNIFFNGVAKAVLATSANVQIQTRDPVGDTAVNIPFQEWVPNFSYSLNDLVLGSNGEFYISLENGNIGNDPTISPSEWEPFFDSIIIGQDVVAPNFVAIGNATTGFSGLDVTAKGSILVGNGTAPIGLPVGDNAEVIIADSTEPSGLKWVPLSEPGLILLSTVTASSSSTVDIEITFDSTYDAYVIVVTGLRLSSNNAEIYLRMKLGGSYADSNYNFHVDRSASSSASYASLNSASAAQITIGACGSGASNSARFDIHIDSPTSTALAKQVYWTGATMDGGSAGAVASGQGMNTATTALTGIRIFPQAGTIVIGDFRLYGYKKGA